jgi:hypothetical protein
MSWAGLRPKPHTAEPDLRTLRPQPHEIRPGQQPHRLLEHLKGTFDLYNVANASTVLVQNNTFGPAWQRPTYILPGRLIKLGAQVDF